MTGSLFSLVLTTNKLFNTTRGIEKDRCTWSEKLISQIYTVCFVVVVVVVGIRHDHT
jgi:hypothetical protein